MWQWKVDNGIFDCNRSLQSEVAIKKGVRFLSDSHLSSECNLQSNGGRASLESLSCDAGWNGHSHRHAGLILCIYVASLEILLTIHWCCSVVSQAPRCGSTGFQCRKLPLSRKVSDEQRFRGLIPADGLATHVLFNPVANHHFPDYT